MCPYFIHYGKARTQHLYLKSHGDTIHNVRFGHLDIITSLDGRPCSTGAYSPFLSWVTVEAQSSIYMPAQSIGHQGRIQVGAIDA